MAYSTRRFIKHIDKYGVVHRIEIQEDGYGGSATSMNGDKGQGAFSFDHEDVADEEDFLKVYANPIQKGMLEVYPLIESDTDFDLLEDIFQSDEEQFRLVWKQDGEVFWTGNVLVDLLEFQEAPYPYTSTIVAKDFSRLEGMDYSLTDSRQTWITTIADLLSTLNLGLDIETATSWTESHLDDSLSGDYDYLNHIQHETKALREFGRTGDETDQPITVWGALEKVLSDNCLILKQVDGVFKIDQLSAYDDPENVLVTIYDSSGTQTAQTIEDKTLSYDRNVRRVKSNGSVSKGFVAIKKAKVTFDHRTQVTNAQAPREIELDGDDDTEPISQFFVSDGEQRFSLVGSILARFEDSTPPVATGRYTVEAGNYYWDQDNRTWQSSEVINTVDLTVEEYANYSRGTGTVNIETDEAPEDADGLFRVTLYYTIGSDRTLWNNVFVEILNAVAKDNTTHINYELVQPSGFSEDYQHAGTWFGDGPIGYSTGALRYGSGDNDLTFDSWQRRGTTTGYRNYHENVLKESVDIQRTWVRRIEAAAYGSYDPTGMLQYRSGNYYYIGGSFDGASGDWNVRLMDVDVQKNSLDTFDDILKFSNEDGTGESSSTSGGGGGGTDTGTLDSRYFKQGSNLSEGDPDAIKSTLGLEIGTDVQAHDAILDDVAANDGSAALDLASLDVDDINIDGNTIQAQNGQNLVLDGNGNDVLVNGQTIRVDKEMTTTDNVIVLNDGETGSGITAGEAGLQFDRGTETDYEILFQESNQLFSIGEVGSLQAVATRPDSPDDTGLTFWNDTENWIETSSDLTFDGTILGAPEMDITDSKLTFGSNTGDIISLYSDRIGEDHMYGFGVENGLYFKSNNNYHWYIETNSDGGTSAVMTLSETEGLILNDTLTGVDVDLSSTLDVGGVSTFDDDVRIHESRLEYIHESGDGDLFFTRLDVDGNNTASLVFGRNFSFDDSDLDILTLNSSAGLDVHGLATFEDDITKDDFSLTTDFSGTGWEGTSAGDFNIRNLVVREAARFRELIIDQLSAVGGSFIYSAARGKVKENDSGTITLEDPNQQGVSQWAVDDIFVVRDVDIDGSEIQFITGRVSSITNPGAGSGNPTITLAQDIAGTSGAISSISEGDVLVQRGNTSDADRQSLIYVTATDSDSPSQKMMDGIDSIAAFNDASNIVAQGGNIGNLNSRYSEIGSGEFGYVSDNFYAAESFRVGDLNTDVNYLQYENDALTGVFDDLDFDSTTYTLTSQGGMVIDSSSGIDLANGDFWHDDGLGSVGGGILTWDGDASELGLAGFTATEKWLTDGQTYIGNDMWDELGDPDHFGKLFIGDPFDDGSASVQARGDVINTYAIMRAPRDSTDYMFRANFEGDMLFQVGLGDNNIAGSFFDEGAQWAGDADKGNATFLADWENQVLEMGSVFSADGANDEGNLANTNFNERYLWAHKPSHSGEPDPTDLGDMGYRFDANTGEIYNDAMGGAVYAKFEEAEFGADDEADFLDNDRWVTTATASGDNNDDDIQTKLRIRLYKRFGVNRLRISGNLEIDSGGTGILDESIARCYMEIENESPSEHYEILSTSGSGATASEDFSFDLDISSLSDNQYYTVLVRSFASVDGNDLNDPGDGVNCSAGLREDLYITEST